MSESGAKGMGESRDPFTAEELYELRREDLNEFTSEDERMPSPKDVWAEETVVLPEIQTMTGYIRQHYEAVLVDEISRRLRYGELCVRHGGKLYRECPEDYPEEDDDDVTVLNTPIEHSYPVASDQKDSLATVRPLGGEITWTSFTRASWNFVEAFVVVTMKVDVANDTEHFETTERYAIDMWFDMEDGVNSEFGNIRPYRCVPDRAGVKLDEYLIPVFEHNDIEKEAEDILLNFLCEGLQDPKYLNSGVLAERLGLHVEHYALYERQHTSSILFFGAGEVLVQNRDAAGNELPPTSVAIEPNTIVVNDSAVNNGKDPVFHECFHYCEHQLFFQLQKLHNNDINCLTKWKSVKLEEGKRSPIEWIEWQARYGGQCLQVPRMMLRKRVNEELESLSGLNTHMGHKLQTVGRKLAKEFSAYNYQIRNRMIQTGYGAAKGALNFVVDDYISPFAFSLDECRGNQTFVITPKEMLDEYVRNEDFRAIIDTGRYIYVDGHVCINDPEYVVKQGNKLKLTEWANAHVDQCCLRFVRTYYRDQQTHYVYGQLNSDEEYNGRNLTLSASERAPQLYQRAMETSRMLTELPHTFHETFAKLMDLYRIKVEKLAEETLLSERSITRYRTKEADDYSVDKVAVLCVGMHLDPLFSLDLMRKAGILLRNTPADLVINAVLMGMHQYSVQEVSRYLKDCGYPRIKNWPDFDKPN